MSNFKQFGNPIGKGIAYTLELLTPYERKLGVIPAVLNYQYRNKVMGLNEIEFDIPAYFIVDQKDVAHPFYHIVDNGMLIQIHISGQKEPLQYIVDTVNESTDKSTEAQKHIHAFSKEYFLSRKKFLGMELAGRILYYTPDLPERYHLDGDGLPRGVLNDIFEKYNIEVTHIDESLKRKAREVSIGSTNIYQFLAHLEETFGCIFKFNGDATKVEIYDSSSFGRKTGITISERNVINTFSEDTRYEDMVTRLYVYGADEISIASVNPTGLPYIDNFSYFLKENYLPKYLIDLYNEFIELPNHNTELNSLVTQRNELLTKKSEAEFYLEVVRDELRQALHWAEALELRENNNTDYVGSDPKYEDSNAWNALKSSAEVKEFINAVKSNTTLTDRSFTSKNITFVSLLELSRSADEELQKLFKNDLETLQARGGEAGWLAEIERLEQEYISVTERVKNLQAKNDFNQHMANSLSAEQFAEARKAIDAVTIEGEYINSDLDSTMLNELLEEGKKELDRMCFPKIQFTVDALDFSQLFDTQDLWNYLSLGDIIYVKTDTGFNYPVHFIGIEHSPDTASLNLQFSSSAALIDSTVFLADLIANATRANGILSLNKDNWNEAAKQATAIRQQLKEGFDLAQQRLAGASKQMPILDERGFWLYALDSNENPKPEQIRAINNVIALTKDGWETVEVAITPEGINANTIVVGTMSADRVRLGRFESADKTTYWDLETNEIKIGDTFFFSPETGLEIDFQPPVKHKNLISTAEFFTEYSVSTPENARHRFETNATTGELRLIAPREAGTYDYYLAVDSAALTQNFTLLSRNLGMIGEAMPYVTFTLASSNYEPYSNSITMIDGQSIYTIVPTVEVANLPLSFLQISLTKDNTASETGIVIPPEALALVKEWIPDLTWEDTVISGVSSSTVINNERIGMTIQNNIENKLASLDITENGIKMRVEKSTQSYIDNNIDKLKGADGADAKLISLSASEQVFKNNTPATITVTGLAQNTSITSWTYSSNSGAFTTTLPAGVTRSGNTVTITQSTMTANTLTIKASDGTYSDTVSIAKLADGVSGTNGFTVLLTNESQTFSANSEGTVTSYANGYSDVVVYYGSTALTCTSTGTAAPTVNNTYTVTSIAATSGTVTTTPSLVSSNYRITPSALNTDNAIRTITVVARISGTNYTFKKVLTYTKSKSGANGADGKDGKDGYTPIKGIDYIDGKDGLPGPAGADSYTHIAYANSADGSVGFSTTDSVNKTHIGIYVDSILADSEDYKKYKWTQIRGLDGKDGIAGKDGVGVKTTTITYGLSTFESAMPTSFTSEVPALQKGQYLWTKTVWSYSDNTTETGYSKTYIAKDGNDGTNGIAGKDGVGIKTTVIEYAQSSSGTTTPSSGWTSTIPSVTQGNYLWTKTTWNYTDNTSETGYSVAHVGKDGANGIPGTPGADGKTPYLHIAYATDANGTNFSTTVSQNQTYIGTYTDFIEADSPDYRKYSWTKIKGEPGIPGINGIDGKDGIQGPAGVSSYTHIAYATNSTGTSGFSTSDSVNKTYIGMYVDSTKADSTDPKKYKWTLIKGNDGKDGVAGKDGVGIKTTTISYGLSTSETINPTTFTSNVPPLIKGQYLWTKTIWAYTDGSSETGYTKTYIAKDGNDGSNGIAGKDGVGIKTTAITYASSTSGTEKPTSDWSTAIPNVALGKYLWTRTIWTYTDGTTETGYSVAHMGKDGANGIPGAPGTDGKTPYLHIAYANSADGKTDFSVTDSVGKTYIGQYTDYTATDSSDPTKYKWTLIKGDKGDTGAKGATGSQGPRGATGTSVSSVTEYYLATSASSGISSSNAGFTTAMQPLTATNKYLWNYEKINFSDGTSQPTIPVIIGVYGDKGQTGATGATGRSITGITEYYLATSESSSVTRSTSGWSTTMQKTTPTNKYLWNYEKITWSSGTTTTYVEPIIIGIHGDKGAKGDTGPKGKDGGNFTWNLIQYTKPINLTKYRRWQNSTLERISDAEGEYIKVGYTTGGNSMGVMTPVFSITQGTTYTFSAWIKPNVDSDRFNYLYVMSPSKGNVAIPAITGSYPASSWTKVTVKFTAPYTTDDAMFMFAKTTSEAYFFNIKEIMISEGDNPNQVWSPHPNDLKGEDGSLYYGESEPPLRDKLWMDSTDNVVKYFNGEEWVGLDREAINYVDSLAINISSDIQNEGDSIRQLVESEYYSKGDVDQLLQSKSTEIQQTDEEIQIKINAINNLINANKEATDEEFANISTYFAFNDEGLLVGKDNVNFKALFNNEKLAFLDDNTEVAYISNKQLYVNDGKIVNSLQLGNFEFVPRASGNLTFRKIGG